LLNLGKMVLEVVVKPSVFALPVKLSQICKKMDMLNWKRPVEGEFIPYQITYLNHVPEGDLIALMRKNIDETAAFLISLPEEKLEFRYAEGKWSIKDVLQHLIDCERIMCYRALRFARKDKAPLAGFEENDYATNANTNERDFVDMVREFIAVRAGTVYMFRSFNDEILTFAGQANNSNVTVNALAYVIAGHEMHHINIIKERYL